MLAQASSARSQYINCALVDSWRSRPRKPARVYPFVYTWYHTTTGNRGVRIVWAQSIAILRARIERINHAYDGKVNYSIFDTSE